MTLEANEDLHHPENDSEANKKNLKQESEHQKIMGHLPFLTMITIKVILLPLMNMKMFKMKQKLPMKPLNIKTLKLIWKMNSRNNYVQFYSVLDQFFSQVVPCFLLQKVEDLHQINNQIILLQQILRMFKRK